MIHLLVIIHYRFGKLTTFIIIKTFTLKNLYNFRHQNKVNHCRIRSKNDRGQIKYYLIEGAAFDSLYSLITHYRKFPLRIHVSRL